MITASGTFKGLLQDTDFVIVDIHGNHLHGKGQASSEQWLHLTVYRLRPDVQTVIHAHPPHAFALMLAGGSMEGVPFPEAAACKASSIGHVQNEILKTRNFHSGFCLDTSISCQIVYLNISTLHTNISILQMNIPTPTNTSPPLLADR